MVPKLLSPCLTFLSPKEIANADEILDRIKECPFDFFKLPKSIEKRNGEFVCMVFVSVGVTILSYENSELIRVGLVAREQLQAKTGMGCEMVSSSLPSLSPPCFPASSS